MGCLGKLFKGCFIFFLITIILLVLLIGFLFRGRLFGTDYELNEDGASYALTDYGSWNFKDKLSIPSKHFGKPVTRIEYEAFKFCKLKNITIPESITEIEDGAFNNSFKIENISVDKNNTSYQSIDGNLYTKDGKALLKYAVGKNATHFTIPDSVTEIKEGAFFGCDALTSISIPNSVTTIGDYAFGCCDNLSDIVIIPDSVTKIGSFAFNYCDKLHGVILPTSVTSLSVASFANERFLESPSFDLIVYYLGSKEEWDAIDFSDYYGRSNYTPIYYYSETSPTEDGGYWYYDANGNIVRWS